MGEVGKMGTDVQCQHSMLQYGTNTWKKSMMMKNKVVHL